MEVKDLAEQILFSSNLDSKLFTPDILPSKFTDFLPEKSFTAPKTPARDKKIQFSSSSTQTTPFPNIDALTSNTSRGVLLHFFANHELLALEIMALVLLKFPNTPVEFRRGIISTIFDEQKHMKLYLGKMQQLGVDFGSVPLNRYFWDSFSNIQTPMDFVTNMSLTFEQANLDFSLYYQQVFKKLDDTEIIKILDDVYQDEIRHVKSGLHWFKEWKSPKDTLWQAYKKQLIFPLTPQRAKGRLFDLKGRKQAGLDDDFILNLKTYSHSKGTAPKVFLFWPDTEDEIMFSNPKMKPYQRPGFMQKLTDDLSVLPTFFASACDIVLTNKQPSLEWKKNILDAGFELPEFVETSEISTPNSPLRKRRLLSLNPWGYSHLNTKLLQPLSGQEAFPYILEEKSRNILYSKNWSLNALKKFIDIEKDNSFCSLEEVGSFVSSLKEVKSYINLFSQQGYDRVVIKAPYGASGRNMFHVFKNREIDFDKISIFLNHSILHDQKVIIEPWLNKAFDYSLQISIGREKSTKETSVKIHGPARFLSSNYGQYKGALLGGFTTGLISEEKKFLNKNGTDSLFLKNHFSKLADFIAKEAIDHNYIGPIGIDAFVYKNLSGKYKIKPIVETNFRYNMGLLVTKLEKKLTFPGEGLWRIFSKAELKKAGFKSIDDFNKALNKYFKPMQKGLKTKESPQFLQASHSENGEFTAYIFWASKLDYVMASLQKIGLK